MRKLISSNAVLGVGIALIFVVSLTTGPVPDMHPDHVSQYDAVRYDVSNDQVVVTHVLTDREARHVLTEREGVPLVSTPTPERLEQRARDEDALSAPEREGIDEGRVRTGEGPDRYDDDVSTGSIYEVDGKYYKLVRTGQWPNFSEDADGCSMSTTVENTFCDDVPPFRLGPVLFSVYGYLAGGFLVVRGGRGGPLFGWEYLETNVAAYAGVGAGLGFIFGVRSEFDGVLLLGLGFAIFGGVIGMVRWAQQHSRV